MFTEKITEVNVGKQWHCAELNTISNIGDLQFNIDPFFVENIRLTPRC